MVRISQRIIWVLLIISMWNKSFSQQNKGLIDQGPVVAGQFYPADRAELQTMLKSLFASAKPDKQDGEVLAIISPHAGYVFSGQVAASAFNQVDPEKEYKTIFVIGSSHQALFNGASIYNKGNFITPLGTIKVDLELADKLISENPVFISKTDAFSREHSLEVQLPFLQVYMKKDFRIIPIILGTQNPADTKKIAAALLPFFTPENLFVFSSYFSHYPDYQNAVNIDKLTTDAIISKSPEKFTKAIQSNENKAIPNLSTSACGWTSLLTLLYMVEKSPGTEIIKIDYQNSGDTKYGDKQRVVGYNALIVTLKKESSQALKNFSVSEPDKKILLEIARSSIEYFLANNKFSAIDAGPLSETLKTPVGVFVTLTKNGNLRGCIGRMVAGPPLYKVVQEMAVSAATNDYRFDKVSMAEMKDIEIEISVLSPLKKIKSIDEIEMKKHGIYLKKGSQSGTFLPQVAEQTGWTKEEFLGHCARDKAGIGWEGWRDAEIFTYEAFIFKEKGELK
jgi:AmmeMemoRadiSam system protein B/AmmeMemoRadiSam system protein A